MLETASRRRPSRFRHHAPEFTFVPADYTVECSDEMPMDDATASDNCGEVTIEVSSETTAGDAAGNYVIVRTSTDRRCWKQQLGHADHHGSGHHGSEFTLVPADYTVECSTRCRWRSHRVDNCGEVTIEVSSETTAGDAAVATT